MTIKERKQLNKQSAFAALMTALLSSKKLNKLIFMIIILFLLPIILICITILMIYRIIISIILRRRFMTGIDAIWCYDIRRKQTKAVINILLTFDETWTLNELRTSCTEKLLPLHSKLKMRRLQYKGFFYWEPMENFDINEFIRELPNCEMKKEITMDELRNIISDISNNDLPYNHTATWEMFLTPQIKTDDGSKKCSLLFRVHHALGDGPFLCKLLFNSLFPKGDLDIHETKFKDYILQKIKRIKIPNILDILYDGCKAMAEMFMAEDEGPLYGPHLTGKRQLHWKSSCELLNISREIKQYCNTSLSSVIITALHSAINDYSKYTNIPLKRLSISLPIKLPDFIINAKDQFDNAFTIGIIDLNKFNENNSALEKIQNTESCIKLGTLPTKMIFNRYFMHLIGTYCPLPIAYRITQSSLTISFSNMPGPAYNIQSPLGFKLIDLVFWTTAVDRTAFGANVLSYNGSLILGMAIDDAVLKHPDDIKLLMNSWEEHIIKLYNDLKIPQLL